MADIFDQVDTAFADVATIAAVAAAPKATPNDFVDPANLHLFARRPVPKLYAGCETGSEGLERTVVLDDTQVFKEGGCGAMREALRTGGVDDDNPRWRIKLFAASFLNGADVASHGMSNKHSDYSHARTEREIARIEADKASRKGGMGWPGCASFEQAGCKECALCPHRGKIRSPLNLAIVKHDVKPGEQPAETHGAVTFGGNEIYPGHARYALPDGWVFNASGHVCAALQGEKTADDIQETVLVPMLGEKQWLLNPFVQEEPHAILFKVNGSMGVLRDVMVERAIMPSTQKTLERLGEQGVSYHRQTKNMMGDFLMELTRKIELLRASAKARAFGWVQDEVNGGYHQFVYGKTFHRNGTETEGGYLNETMRRQYAPVGKIEPWIKAAQYIVIDQNRPELTNFLAYTFAAVLIQLTGQPLVVGSLCGHSGDGKSTVLKLGAAAWGHPEESRITNDPTLNAVGHKMGMLANLPVFFDEVTAEKPMENVVTVLHMDGVERARLFAAKSGLQMRASGHWATLLCTTGNRSLLDFVSTMQRDTAMGRYRIFETPLPKREGDDQRSDPVVEKMMSDLRFNYGQVGLVYAKFLASKSADLEAMLLERRAAFDKLVAATQQERFWSIICACTLLGAQFAVELGLVKFDLKAMETFLVAAFKMQREKLKADGQEGDGVAVELLTAFMKDHQQHMLVTDGLPGRGGAPNKTPFNILRQPGLDKNKGIHIQWVDRPSMPILRISRDKLIEWLTLHKRQPSVVFDRIKHRVSEKVVLGGKTGYAAGPERVVEFDVFSDSWLKGVLNDIVGRPTEEATAPATGEQGIINAAAVAKQKDTAHEA